jgi:hypothetical protein
MADKKQSTINATKMAVLFIVAKCFNRNSTSCTVRQTSMKTDISLKLKSCNLFYKNKDKNLDNHQKQGIKHIQEPHDMYSLPHYDAVKICVFYNWFIDILTIYYTQQFVS